MQDDQKERARELSYYILAYLSENPEAGDTFDGIVEWWLLRQRIKFETRNVSEAVTKLVSEGLIEEHEGSDSRIFYRVKRTKEQDVKSLLMHRDGSFEYLN
jgi:DNA-binding MarR family transcriptional regulator